LLGWKEDEWRKQATGVSVVPPEKRPRTKDEDDWDMTLKRYRHFVSGYYQPVPPGQKPFTIEAPRIKLALVGLKPRTEPSSPSD